MTSGQVTDPAGASRLMLHALVKNWWLLLLKGLCAIAFGVLAFVWPGVTLVTLILFYGAFALVDGVIAIRPQSWAARPRRAGGSRSSGSSASRPAW